MPPRGRPGDKTDVALSGFVDDLSALWATSGRRLSGRGRPLQRFVLELAQLIDPALTEGRVTHALRACVEDRSKRSAQKPR
ncbi:MAG: hypothetical protein HYR63_17520 [Proteobacteria bacterium]|nr:hypothetical protein [Pseudomonadota bacterium]